MLHSAPTYVTDRLALVDPSPILIENTIFFNIASNAYTGGALYIQTDKDTTYTKLADVGFSKCSVAQGNGGAVFINSSYMILTNVCATSCSCQLRGQFGYFCTQSNVDESNFSQISLDHLQPESENATSAILLTCSSYPVDSYPLYSFSYLNSSYHLIRPKASPYGVCFRYTKIASVLVEYFTFSNCIGNTSSECDLINAYQDQNKPPTSATFRYGSIVNCTAESIMRYMGNIVFQSVTFHSNQIYKTAFVETLSSSTITFGACYSDTTIHSNIIVSNTNPVSYPNMPNLDYCPIVPPTSVFTNSDFFTLSDLFTPSRSFTMSNAFSRSSAFTQSSTFTSSSAFSSSMAFHPSSPFSSSLPFPPSNYFTPSNVFSKTESFTKSETFTDSDPFTLSDYFTLSLLLTSTFSPKFETGTFTPSDPFTPSYTFSPERTKYPDGLNNKEGMADVYGSADIPASSIQIGVTTGISVVVISVSVVLMVLYLHSQQRNLSRNKEAFSGALESDDTLSTSYSYSFYTYSYYSCNPNDSSVTSTESIFPSDDSDKSYSDFRGTDNESDFDIEVIEGLSF